MRDLISKGLLTAAAATSVLSLSGGYALAAEADGVAADSPGVLSGNSVQAPVDIPVNVCGNTVNPIGLLNPAFGNTCVNASSAPAQSASQASSGYGESSSHSGRPSSQSGPSSHAQSQGQYGNHQAHASHLSSPGGTRGDGAQASGIAKGSPGVLSGNLIQAPVHAPVNTCGNSVDLVGLLNPTFGNTCVNGAPEAPEPPQVAPPERHHHEAPPTHQRPEAPISTPEEEPHFEGPELAHTGSDSHLLAAGAMSLGLLIGGGILYRRNSAGARA
ncbi:chaplin family protein [Streptomyces sp. NPDC058220]|uniref:chaplin n=1 Tax=unclassified Streptomyces TaxID=2593676 RepID=UPI0036637591